jgi:hypothetical protein
VLQVPQESIHDRTRIATSSGERASCAKRSQQRTAIATDASTSQRFEQLLRNLDAGMSKQELTLGFREVDTDRDGLIDTREFIEWWKSD